MLTRFPNLLELPQAIQINNEKQGKIMISQQAKSDKGEVKHMWEGKDNTYWALVSYWIGTGYQNVERKVSRSVYEGWLVDNE